MLLNTFWAVRKAVSDSHLMNIFGGLTHSIAQFHLKRPMPACFSKEKFFTQPEFCLQPLLLWLRLVAYSNCLEMQGIFSLRGSTFNWRIRWFLLPVSSCAVKKIPQILNLNILKSVINTEEHSVWLHFDPLCVVGVHFFTFCALKINLIKQLWFWPVHMIPWELGFHEKPQCGIKSHAVLHIERLTILGGYPCCTSTVSTELGMACPNQLSFISVW